MDLLIRCLQKVNQLIFSQMVIEYFHGDESHAIQSVKKSPKQKTKLVKLQIPMVIRKKTWW